MNATLLIFLVIAAGGMWLMTSRQRKQQAAANEFRNNLVAGDEVMTGSGLFGTVVDVEGDVITLESTPGSRTRWLRAAIAKKIDPVVETPEAEDAVDPAIHDADRIQHANDAVIDVPDDLSSLPHTPGDDDQDETK